MGYYSEVCIAIAYVPDGSDIKDDDLEHIKELIQTLNPINTDLAIQLLHALEVDTSLITAIKLFLNNEWSKYIIPYDDHIKIVIESIKLYNWGLFDELLNILKNAEDHDYGIITSGEEFDDVKYYGDPSLYNIWISKGLYYD